jgi:LuxR family transcriptional regulator of spore coat protein
VSDGDHKLRPILTARERQVFEWLVQNQSTKDIAERFIISEKTVRNHISNVMQKLGVKGRSQAVVELVKRGELKI